MSFEQTTFPGPLLRREQIKLTKDGNVLLREMVGMAPKR